MKEKKLLTCELTVNTEELEEGDRSPGENGLIGWNRLGLCNEGLITALGFGKVGGT